MSDLFKVNPKCPNCKGRGYELYEDPWDRDNYTPCFICFPNPLVTVQIASFKNKTVSKITCGEDRTFEEVLKGLKACVAELEDQIKNRKKCPANKTKV